MEALALCLVIGIVCLIAAVVGGNVRFPGVEIPMISSRKVRIGLAAVGILSFGVATYLIAFPKGPHVSPKTDAPVASQSSPTSSSQPSTPVATSPGVSKSEYMGQADAICRDSVKRLNAMIEGAQSQFSNEADYIDALVDEYVEVFLDLRALPTPEEDRYLLDSMYRSAFTYTDTMQQTADAIRAGDADAEAEARRANDAAFKGMRSFGEKYGFNICPPGA